MLIRLFPARGGDCFLVDFENGHCILIDGGYSNTYNNSLRKYLQFLCDKGKQLDFVIMTHYDADHINGLIAFLKDNGANQRIIKVGEVIVNGFCSQACDDSDLDQVAKMKTGVEITPAGPKQEYRFEELCMDNHYPINKFNGGNNVTAGDVAKGEGYEIRFVSPSPEQLDTCYAQLNQQLIDKGYRQNIINLQNLAISLQEESYHEEGIVISEASGGVDSDIIHWKEKDFPDKFSIVNQASLAFEILHDGKAMLFCGDAAMDSHRDDLSREYYDVIKLSHHGTVRGNECFFGVNSIKGDIYIISTDAQHAKREHPARRLLGELLTEERENQIVLYCNYDIADVENKPIYRLLKDERQQEKYRFKVKLDQDIIKC